GLPGAVTAPADPQALALAQRVVHEALVLAQRLALGRHHGARLARQVAREEFAERALADEADAGGVALGVIGQPGLARDAANLGLAQVAHRKERARELRLVQA